VGKALRVKRFLKDNSLSLVLFFLFFVTFIVGQSYVGMHAYNDEQKQHNGETVGYAEYLTTAHFGEATFENWESEFLQMGVFVVLTVFLRQRGSSESKPVEGTTDVDEKPEEHRDDPHAPGPVKRGGLALTLYKNSLSLAFLALFLVSFWLHALTGAREYNNEQKEHKEEPVSTLTFVKSSEFWFQSLQNWQSEFLAVASIVVLSVYLRQHGSPESKPVHMPHAETPA
jgi:hypothetical protein